MAALLRYPSPHSLSLTYSDTHTGTRALGFLAIPTNPVLPECKAPPGVGQKPAHPGMGEPHWKSRLGVSLSTVTWGVGWGALLPYQYCLLQGNNPQPSQNHQARLSRPGGRGGGKCHRLDEEGALSGRPRHSSRAHASPPKNKASPSFQRGLQHPTPRHLHYSRKEQNQS